MLGPLCSAGTWCGLDDGISRYLWKSGSDRTRSASHGKAPPRPSASAATPVSDAKLSQVTRVKVADNAATEPLSAA